MSRLIDVFRESLLVGAFLLLMVAALPVLAILLFLGRFVVAGVAFVVLAGGFVAIAVSPRFREWLDAQAAMETDYKGLHLDAEVALHPSHCWAKIEPDAVYVGVDDLVQTLLGPVDSVNFPSVGSRVKRGDRLFRLGRGERSVGFPAPASGTVVGCNEDLVETPWLVNQSPFSRGWVVRLQGETPWADRRRLMRGTKAQDWFRHEVDRMISSLVPKAENEPSPALSLADGGTLVLGLYRQIDDETWSKLEKDFFWFDSDQVQS